MKYTCHVPIEQFGFIAVEVEGGPDDALEAYRGVQRQLGANPGLGAKEWNAWLDLYLSNKTAGPVEEWELMSTEQKITINEIKKAFKRLTK